MCSASLLEYKNSPKQGFLHCSKAAIVNITAA